MASDVRYIIRDMRMGIENRFGKWYPHPVHHMHISASAIHVWCVVVVAAAALWGKKWEIKYSLWFDASNFGLDIYASIHQWWWFLFNSVMLFWITIFILKPLRNMNESVISYTSTEQRVWLHWCWMRSQLRSLGLFCGHSRCRWSSYRINRHAYHHYYWCRWTMCTTVHKHTTHKS